MQIVITINDFEERGMPHTDDHADLAATIYDDVVESFDIDHEKVSITFDRAKVDYMKLFGWYTARYPQPEGSMLYCDEAGDVRTKYV